jgi:hypothetical protein
MAILRDRVVVSSKEKEAIQAAYRNSEDVLTKAIEALPKGVKGSRAEYEGLDAKVSDRTCACVD